MFAAAREHPGSIRARTKAPASRMIGRTAGKQGGRGRGFLRALGAAVGGWAVVPKDGCVERLVCALGSRDTTGVAPDCSGG